ncbi:MAG: glycosyltransferase [Oscillospiraceae bacterium]|nr:glycosyltransferase [Oscillospiraceae bacterium]
MPQLSVIIPAYNAGQSLEKCVLSILEHKNPALEVIIVNDGSTDNTAAVCDRLAAIDKRVTVLHRQNSGVSEARNAGIDASAGEYIAFADADDRLSPDAYERMIGALAESGAQCAVCGYYLTMQNDNCKPIKAPLPHGLHNYDDIVEKLIIPLFSDRVSRNLILGTVWRYLFKRSVIIENNIRFFGAYLEDEIFLMEYFSYSTAIYSIDEPLYFYLQNPYSVTRRHMPDCVAVFCASLKTKEKLALNFARTLPPYWRDNTLWAGLLIAVSNEFAPGNKKSLAEKLKTVRAVCKQKDFDNAIKNYRPRNMSLNKMTVSFLIRFKLFFPLAVLYSLKNRN